MKLKQAIGDSLLLKELFPERKSAGGIHIPATAREKHAAYGRVEAVGPKVTDDEIKVGAVVVFSRYHAKTRVNGRELQIVSEGDIYAVVEPEEHDKLAEDPG